MQSVQSVSAKQSFSAIYDQAAPTEYFENLSKLQYRSQDFVWNWVHDVNNQELLNRHVPRTVLDVGCSYGINSMVLKWGLPFRAAASLLSDPQTSTSVLNILSKRRSHIKVVGIDTATQALDFARSSGLIDASIDTDANKSPLSALDASKFEEGVDIVMASGVFSYVGAVGFDRILASTRRRERFRFVGWPLYGDDVVGVEEACVANGLSVLGLENPRLLPQRLYATVDEKEYYRDRARARGLVFDGTLAETFLCATQFVAIERGL